MTDRELLGKSLLDLAPDCEGDHIIEPTVLFLGDVPTYEDKVPDEYGEQISGTVVDEYEDHPIVKFSPRSAHVDDDRNAILLHDGHLGTADCPDLPAEFEHVIERDQYVVAAIYQKGTEDYDPVRVTDVGSAVL